ncbi:MAG TPA: tetratricopeptide repeat protein [Gemmatimonadaceae bacterium]|nr:tetratricopeptide repeat protein [Gemmatimonadaceae bacterium]
MNANQQSALAALRSVSPIAARLDRSRDGEDRAADILELWQGTETSLRALAGGSSLGGQALIRELRQQELISLGQAYALLEFLGARDRANRTTYRASDNDVAVAREGYRQLETGLAAGETEPPPLPPRDSMAAGAGAAGAATASTSPYAQSAASPSYSQPTSPYAPGASRPAPGPVTPPAAPYTPVEPAPGYATAGRRIPANLWFIVSLVVIVLALAGGYWMWSGRSNPTSEMNNAVTMSQSGRREAAKGEFSRIGRDNPNMAAPHVFLARMAREDGDIATARREAETAIRLEPKNSTALREMGLILFSTGDYEVSRRFFVRAIEANPADNASQGYLGCALARLNRLDEAQKFLTRAGNGVWSSCMQRTL